MLISAAVMSPLPLRHTALPPWPISHNLSFPKHPHISKKYTEEKHTRICIAFIHLDSANSILAIAARDWWDCLRTFHRGAFLRLRLFPPLPKYQISSVSHLFQDSPIWNISFSRDLADPHRIIPLCSFRQTLCQERGNFPESAAGGKSDKGGKCLLDQALWWCLS